MVELLKRRTRLEECEVRYYLLQLVAAVRHMHARGIIHRDLKLGNIFLDQVRAQGPPGAEAFSACDESRGGLVEGYTMLAIHMRNLCIVFLLVTCRTCSARWGTWVWRPSAARASASRPCVARPTTSPPRSSTPRDTASRSARQRLFFIHSFHAATAFGRKENNTMQRLWIGRGESGHW